MEDEMILNVKIGVLQVPQRVSHFICEILLAMWHTLNIHQLIFFYPKLVKA